jgi:hypothetical protein
MRINIYSQVLLLEKEAFAVELGSQTSNTGVVYSFVRMFLHSSDRLHAPPRDDDRSAITIWLPKSPIKRAMLRAQLRRMADLIEKAPPETGLD